MNRLDLLSRAESAREIASYTLPDGGIVHVRGMTAKERDAFEQSCFLGAGRSRSQNLANVRARLLVLTICDEVGERLLSDGDADKLGDLPARTLDPLFDLAQKLSGIGKGDVEELAGNSDGVQSGSSSSV